MDLMMWIWLGIFVLMVIIEAATSVSLTSIWFAVGALAAILAVALGAPVWAQTVCFAAVGFITIATLRPYMRKYIAPKVVKSGLECIIGQTAVVVEDVSKTAGVVTIDGQLWTARTSGEAILSNDECVIEEMDGIKLIVGKSGLQ
ncbi:MAG: NfeD family protein [Oscillospiraceae bacterium]|nr:NfeD family protein [Oscillospiraceae bacterium]